MATATKSQVVNLNSIKVACTSCSLQQLCLPVGVEMKDISRLDDIIRRRRPVARNHNVFCPGDIFTSLYAIRSGSVKSYIITEDGGEQITGFYLPGELVGLDAICAERHPCGAKALETTSLCEIPYDKLEELSAEVPELGRQMMRIMSREIQSDESLLMVLGKKSAEERLASLLISLSTRFQVRGFSHSEFTISMSRSDIANYLGLAVETVSRLFSRFQQQGIIAVQHKRVQLLRLEQLQMMAGIAKPSCQRSMQA